MSLLHFSGTSYFRCAVGRLSNLQNLNFFFQEALEQLQRMNLAELQTRLVWTWCWPFCVTKCRLL